MNKQIFADNIRHLRESKHLKQSDIQSVIGFSRTTWNNYENGVSYPKLADLEKIANYFGVLESDLLRVDIAETDMASVLKRYNEVKGIKTKPVSVVVAEKNKTEAKKINPQAQNGNGNKYYRIYEEAPLLHTPKIVTINEEGIDNIVYVPVKAQAGYLSGYGDREFIEQLPTFRMPGLNNATYRMFEVSGLSMSPTLSDRDRVIAEWVPNINELRENRVHVMVLQDGVCIKRVLNRIAERGKLYLKSDTITHRADYPIREIEPSEVIEIWYVRMKVSSDLSEPTEVYTRLADLELNQMEIMRKLGLGHGK